MNFLCPIFIFVIYHCIRRSELFGNIFIIYLFLKEFLQNGTYIQSYFCHTRTWLNCFKRKLLGGFTAVILKGRRKYYALC